jgi:hypothetical protein
MISRSRGYLPHIVNSQSTYFVTFRLADSLPTPLLLSWMKMSANAGETPAVINAGQRPAVITVGLRASREACGHHGRPVLIKTKRRSRV